MKGRRKKKHDRGSHRVAFWATVEDGRLTGGENLERAMRLLKQFQNGDVRVVVWGRSLFAEATGSPSGPEAG